MNSKPVKTNHPSDPYKIGLKYLRCPQCYGELLYKDSFYLCESCKEQFPIIDRVPYLTKQRASYFWQWFLRADFFRHQTQAKTHAIDQTLSDSSLGPKTRLRLQNTRGALTHNLEKTLNLLSSVLQHVDLKINGNSLSSGSVNPKTLSLGRVAKTQHIDSYFLNLFRDWSWGAEEVRQITAAVGSSLGSETKSVAIMGSGAGRLSEDLTHNYQLDFLISFDINAFFCQTHEHLRKIGSLEFFEIPPNPQDVSACQLQELSNPHVKGTSSPEGSHSPSIVIGADAINPPLAPLSMDAIVCPWFIDIVPEDTERLIQRYNAKLRKGGRLIIYGFLGYSKPGSRTAYTHHELIDLAEKHGYKTLLQETSWQPYLHSPYGSQRRTELCHHFIFEKVSEATPIADFFVLPNWIRDTTAPIPESNLFSSLFSQGKIQTEVLSLVNGKNSILDIAQILHQHYSIPKTEAEYAVVNILSNITDGDLAQ